MKAVKIGELKNNLSKYLRLVRNGETIRVLDRDEPIAELGPTRPTGAEVFARLAADGKCKSAKAGPAVWEALEPLKLKRKVTMSELLEDLRAVHGE